VTVLGIGPVLLAAGGVPLATVLLLERVYGIAVRLPSPLRRVAKALGVVLCAIGAFFWLSSAMRVEKAFHSHRLETSGVFRRTRHPLYAAFIVFVVPGAALIRNNLLMLAASLDMYVAFKLKIGKEEEYLLREFGEEYLEYEREVPQLFPLIKT
jgi:protein-S-isoprenylcysteine O-methyltransferase Ste14